MKARIVFIVLAVAVLVFLADQTLVAVKSYSSHNFALLLEPAFAFFSSFVKSTEESPEILDLRRENELLKAQILALENFPRLEQNGGSVRLTAKIYSTYPFNNRGLVSINAGASSGVVQGMAVTIQDYFLLGYVAEAKDRYSLVRTVFDSGWELPVKIGDDAVDALFVGGREPKLTLITEDKEIEAGQVVYSASKDFPYGLKIGEIKEVFDGQNFAFKEASLNTAYPFSVLSDAAVVIR
ncbi:MAG TPA: rod shape-determining protein MreC [Candidatus Paceibacterota bacterium]